MFVKEFLHVMLFTSVHIFHGLFATFVESLLTCVLLVGETGARCNNFAFELHNFLSKENKPKQNITFGSPFS